MSTPNPLSYNAYIQTVGVMAVELTSENSGVYSFNNAPLQVIVPQMLNYAELRIQRDLDFLSAQTSNTYTLTAGQQIFSIPTGDFFVVNTLEVVQPGGAGAPSGPLTEVSKEFVQNVFGSSLSTAGIPKYYAKYGDSFGGNQDTNTNIYFGPTPGYGFSLKVTGTQRTPSLYSYASTGIADTNYTYISQYLPDLLVMASMIFVSAYQRNWGFGHHGPEDFSENVTEVLHRSISCPVCLKARYGLLRRKEAAGSVGRHQGNFSTSWTAATRDG